MFQKFLRFLAMPAIHPISHLVLENKKIPRSFAFRGYPRNSPFLGRLALVLGVAKKKKPKAKKG